GVEKQAQLLNQQLNPLKKFSTFSNHSSTLSVNSDKSITSFPSKLKLSSSSEVQSLSESLNIEFKTLLEYSFTASVLSGTPSLLESFVNSSI
ncbi:MAG: hypothetical protein LBD88_05325, partial [Candidatus Peribacteria bacterium]|nr:hypothetical protein [Candidatus Peribacteria bacterium]